MLGAMAVFCLAGGPARADSEVPLDSWVYRELDRLQAAGLIESGSLSSRPISRQEAARLTAEARRLSTEKDEHRHDAAIARLEQEFAAELADDDRGGRTGYLRPLDEARAGALYVDGPFRPANDRGRDWHEGTNARADVSTLFLWGPLAGYARVEGRHLPADDHDGSGTGGELESGHLKLNLGKWYALAGREPLWWGPGRHGSLLLSDNARPLDLIRVGNDQPVLLPWVFNRVGPLHLEAFLSQIDEEDRPINEPYFAGVRVSVTPLPQLELGASRVAMFGGHGRSVTPNTIDKVITGRGENEDNSVGNQQASVDLRLTLPFRAQPVQLYGEYGGEDMAGNFFSREAVLAGLYLPRVGPWARLDLRIEYADTWLGGHNGHEDVWYRHGLYPLDYDGRIIGHHAGTDARDAYGELGFQATDDLRLWAAADVERHGLGRSHPERQGELTLGAEWWLTRRLAVRGSVTRVELDNAGFEDGRKEDGQWIGLSATWRF